MNFLLGKESSEKKTSVKNELKVNSNSFLVYRLSIIVMLSIISVVIFNSNFTYADNVDYSVVVEPAMNVTVSASSISLNLNPLNKTFDSKNLTVSVGTNNPTGYQLYVSTANDNTNLIEENDSSLYIETLSSEVDADHFTANRWGYKLNSTSTNFSPFTSGTLVNSSNGPIANNSTTMTFGAKVNYDTKPGIYNLALDFKTVPKMTQEFMQNLDPSICTEEPTMVMDSRDSQLYAIARLKDGNCWMLQNLKLGKNTDSIALTSDTSDVSNAGFTLTNKSSDGKFPNYTVDGVIGQNNNSLYYCTDDYGCYYNWYTATGGSGTTATVSGNAANSICPAGWGLPTQPQWATLSNAYDNSVASLLVNPTSATENINGVSAPGFLLGGGRISTGGSQIGSYSVYWLRTTASTQRGYSIYVDSSSVNTADTSNKCVGFTVRCVMKKPLDSVTTMQEVTPSIVAAASEGDTAILRDTRDDQVYSVAKINGNLWMTRNLAIGCNGSGNVYGSGFSAKNLVPATSNVADSTYTTSTTSLISATNKYDYTTAYQTCDSTHGAWYNYAAASAGTIVGDSNENTQTYDICPSGWRLPTNNEFVGLVNTSGSTTLFKPIAGGSYFVGSIVSGTETTGLWWGSTSQDSTHRYRLTYTDGNIVSGVRLDRTYGIFVRCIKSNS